MAGQQRGGPPDDAATVALRLSDLREGPPAPGRSSGLDGETVALRRPGGPDPTGAGDRRASARPSGPAERSSLLVQGLAPAALAAVLGVATAAGLVPLVVIVLGVQLFLVLGVLALLDAPASGGAFLVAVLAAVAADAVVLLSDGDAAGVAGVLGLGMVVALVHQLSRRTRSRVTESLADTVLVVVAVCAAACLLAVRELPGGSTLLIIGLASAGAVLLVGRVGDRLLDRPLLAPGATRGWPGLVLGLVAGVAAALLAARLGAPAEPSLGSGSGLDLPIGSAALVGLVVAATVATADLVVDLAAVELRRGWRDARRVASLRPTALLLPFALLGPVVLLAARLVLA